MFLPIRTDRKLRHTPWMNLILIGANVAVFFLAGESLQDKLRLDPVQISVAHYVTYQFLHANAMHLAGNMLFLWVFGNSVEDRLGKVGYLLFYLAGGVMAGLGHVIIETAPVVGASGSVSAVAGAFLVLFAGTRMTVVFFFIMIGAFEVSSIVVLLFQIGKDLFGQAFTDSNVAHLAHLSGYAFGILVAFGLLWSRLLTRESCDLIALVGRYRNRYALKRMTRKGYSPWQHEHEQAAQASTAGPLIQRVPAAQAEHPTASPEALALRRSVAEAITAGDLSTAGARYAELLDVDSTQHLPPQQQVEIANQLMADQQPLAAARAYELYLQHHGSDPGREQIELMLALIYERYLNLPGRAAELATAALKRLHDDAQKDMAKALIERCTNRPE